MYGCLINKIFVIDAVISVVAELTLNHGRWGVTLHTFPEEMSCHLYLCHARELVVADVTYTRTDASLSLITDQLYYSNTTNV